MTSMPVGWQGWAGDSLIMGLTQSADRPGGGMPQRATLCPPGDEETREKVPLWCLGLRFWVYRTITRLGLGQEAGPKAHFSWG